MTRSTRREFLQASVAASTAFWVAPELGHTAPASPNEKLNLAIIGPGGRGYSNLMGVRTENVVALCEVDQTRGKKALEEYPQAAVYEDFRKLLDKEEQRLDGVVISTPDHVHVPAAVNAMRRGLHCYCEKPLSHDVYEARLATETAQEQGVVTQLGTQIHARDNYRRVVEIVRAGLIGTVDEAHVWVNTSWGGGERPQKAEPVPATLNWDLWLGPAPERPYHSTYVPFHWRKWWDFGSGSLGDMGCHYVDLVFWSLGLKYPTRVKAEGPPVHPETAPVGLKATYEFPARGEQPPLTMTWYDGDRVPKRVRGHRVKSNGVLFVGSEGMLFADYGSHVLLPEEKFADVERPPQTIPKSIGHHREWIEACKAGTPNTTCDFSYSGPLTETVLLGLVAYRAGQELEWDAEQLKATNCPEADAFVRRPYRKGWELESQA